MNKNRFTQSQFNLSKPTPLDIIRQEYFDIIHPNNESNPSMLLDYKGKIKNFIQNVCDMLNNKLEPKALNEIAKDTVSCFSIYQNFSLPCLCDFLPKSKLNANYIITTASIISELTITQQKVNDIMIDSFVDESLNEILLQIQNSTTEISLFGHAIPQEFKNTLIINLLISSKITPNLSSLLLFLYHILPDYLFSKDKKFNFLLHKMIDSSLIDISIGDYDTEQELLKMISNISIELSTNLNKKTLSFIACVIFYIKNNGEKDIKGLDTNSILPFLAIMTIYLQHSKEHIIFSHNSNFSKLVFNGFELLENKSSDLLKTSFEYILSVHDFVKTNKIIQFDQYTKIFSILATKFFKNQFTFDLGLIFPFLLTNSFYYLSFFNTYGMDLFDYLVKNCSRIDYLKSNKINTIIFKKENILEYIKRLNKSNEIIQTIHFLDNYYISSVLEKFTELFDFLIQYTYDKINDNCWDDAILIGKFIIKSKGYCFKQMNNSLLPKHAANILFNKNKQELNISELLSCILNENKIEKNNLYFRKLYNIMIEDHDIRLCYLEHLICANTGDCIHSSMLLQKLLKEYEKYQDDLIHVVKKIIYFNSNCILYKKENNQLHSIVKSELGNAIIREAFNKINDEPDNYQAFICLFNIAKSFPFLFYHDPIQAFESVLHAFDYIKLMFNGINSKERSAFIKTTIAAIYFLSTIMQYHFILDNFFQWFLKNILSFSNSQIYGFIFLLFFNTKGEQSKIILGYILKFNFLENITKILENEYQDSTFKSQFFTLIFNFLNIIFQTMMNLSNYEIIQIEEIMKNSFPIASINISSIQCNNSNFLNMFKKFLDKKDESISEKFMSLFEKENALWLSSNLGENRNNIPTPDQINYFIKKMSQNITELKKPKNIPTFQNFYTINMLRYLFMKPKFIYKWFLYGQKTPINNENIGMFLNTYEIMTKLHNNAKEDPNNTENIDCELLNKIDYFKSQITILTKLITSLSFNQKDLELFKTFLKNNSKNCLYSISFIDYLFNYFHKLSTNYDEANLHSIHSLIDLLKYLLEIDEYHEVIKDFLKYNLIDFALSPEWRNDFNLLQKTLDVMINYNSELPDHICILVKFILMENINQFGSIINIYPELNQEQKDKLNKNILNCFDKIVFRNKVKTIIDCYNKLPILHEYKKNTLIRFLNINSTYFKNNNNLNEDALKFLFESFETLTHHYTIMNNEKKELSPEFFNIYNKYNDIFSKIIKNNPKQFKKIKFLLDFPGLISFNTRLNIFKEIIKTKMIDETINFSIRRNNIFESSYLEFINVEPKDLFKKIKIKYIGEKGYDMGGLLRDWFSKLSLEIFNPNFALFSCFGKDKSYQPNKQSFINDDHLKFFKFAGQFVARALIEDICINVNFTTSFWKQILHYEPNIDDLKEIDSQLYNSFQNILNTDVDSLCLSFTTNEDLFGSYLAIPLKENGDKIDVTNENKKEYIHLLSDHLLVNSIKNQVDAFCEGFYSLIPYKKIRMFTPKELNMLIGGTMSIDVNDFRRNTEYESPYTANTHVVKLFFDVISKWDNEKLSKLLIFITGSSRLPVNGFKGFCENSGPIIIAPLGEKNKLPVAHTCFNRIDLPEYDTKEELSKKLLMAIENCNSFEII